ncbi:kinase-like protein [Pleomassaria siparia CBS 279.74]|uniref:non-specific serine/threonine protein kinase n=1 Tax=Pleomassaria siparia CBS 279.74 TaxID=1314801 RepID=A0A6G1KH19_9PLEO|nr:kinase-like protein [Pleomassaria siparia CBS 279.74]
MTQKEREQLQAELSILKELRHPNIVAYFERDHIKASQDLHLYMEYCGNGDLGRVINDLKRKNQLAEEEFVWSIFSQIVSALYRCHYGEDPPPAGQNVLGLGGNAKPRGNTGRPMILHRDLKPENIFLGHDNSVKLGDFGLSKILQSHDFASTYVGTPFYMSPEICKAEQYGPHSDIWALGCIMYEMCSKSPPFNAKTHFELIQKIKIGNYPPIPSCYSAELGKVIASCLRTHPTSRPDTAQLLNLPAVKVMRKEQEVVFLGRALKDKLEHASRREKEAQDAMARYQELEGQLRREWEVKARLEIDRQVKIEVERQMAMEMTTLQKRYDEAVAVGIRKELEVRQGISSTSPKLAPRSLTPTMPSGQQLLFSTEPTEPVLNGGGSFSTLGTASGFASGTDLSSLSIEDSPEDCTAQPVSAPAAAPKPASTKRSARVPLSRARTMFAAPTAHPPASPMDVQMAEPSPAPASIAGLSLSPRRTAPRKNIFTAAKEGGKKWEADVPPSPTEDEWNGNFDEFDDMDDLPALPSPTRARSASGGRNGLGHEDPFKALAMGQRHILKPTQRLTSVPSLVPNGTKPRPSSVVPIVATSPSRQKSRPVEALSPVRKTASAPTKTENTGFRSKKGAEFRMMAARNNVQGVQGRTLVELQQARGIPVQTLSEDEGKRGLRTGTRSPMKARSQAGVEPAVWDPEVDIEMPSPFIRRQRKAI